ncbi:GNAT family N-acetyltransferase [Arthrobacter sp. TMN-37]
MIAALSLPIALRTPTQRPTLRRADAEDLTALTALLADDPVSAGRGDRTDGSDVEAYRSALDEVIADPSNDVLVVDDGGAVLAMMQLTRIPGLSRRGATRLLVEAVRVRGGHRSSGIGSAMMRWVITTAAAESGASLVQLTSDAARAEAHRFYERLGFTASHRGFKLQVQ